MSDEAQQAARSQQLAAEMYAEPLLENSLLAASAARRSLSRAEEVVDALAALHQYLTMT